MDYKRKCIMYKILSAETLAADIRRIRIEAPLIARKRKPGQFIVLRIDDKGERVPLTIVDSDPEEGSITLIVQGIGKSTRKLNALQAGESILDLVGPLGKPSEIQYYGTVVVIGGGVGTAVAFPTAKGLKEAGNKVISIVGARTRELIILEKELEEICDTSYITTDDGSYGIKGFVTQKLQSLIDGGEKIDFVLAIGPIPMMRAIAELTRPYQIHTVVSLNPIMVDGIGMCGGCRAEVDHKTVFVCVDGPEFDGHKVDFTSLSNRNRSYASKEKEALDAHLCRLEQEIENFTAKA
jgi:ferredoxin/flavodoxin---NADP+ reductase